MDIGAAPVKDLQITSRKKYTFLDDCQVVVVNIILKLFEKTAMHNKKSASKFKAFADGLSHI